MRFLSFFILAAALLSAPTYAQDSPGRLPKEIQLRELRVEGTIFEPQVLFVLEKPSLDLVVLEESTEHHPLADMNEILSDVID